MDKIDFKKQYKHLYQPPSNPVIVDVPPLNYLMIDGKGDPNTSQDARDAIETLFPVSYALKFKVKKEKGIDYSVMPLEGLWWTNDMSMFTIDNKNIWNFTYMIMQPEYSEEESVNKVVHEITGKKNLTAIGKIRFITLYEGPSAQIMYTGPFSEEGPAIKKLHTLIGERGGSFDGTKQKHHEIYLSDYRKTASEKLRTVIRQPFIV
jgi:hypothetical protein